MRIAAFLLLCLGIAVAVALVIQQGAAEIALLIVGAGWWVAAVTAMHTAPILLNAMAWHSLLLPMGVHRPIPALFWMRWVADSVNQLLPAAQLGGEVLRGHMLSRSGVPGVTSGASIVVDLLGGLVSLILFIFIGGGLLMDRGGDPTAARTATVGVGLFVVIFFVLIAAHRSGAFLSLARALERMNDGRAWRAMTGGASALDRALVDAYRRPVAFLRCTLWHLAAWCAGAAQIWVAAFALGYPISFLEALIVDSAGQAVRNLGFAVPGQLGVQEAGYLGAGTLVGLPSEVGLSIALIKRIRDIALGVPALIAWQAVLGRRVFRRAKR